MLAFTGLRELLDVLYFAIHADKSRREAQTAQLRDMLATAPKAGTNTALVSHTANLQEAAGIWPKLEGGAPIFKPEGGGKFSYVGMLQPDEWAQ